MDKRIKSILRYLEGNLEERITLKQTSEMVNLSYGYFSELFQREVGTNFSQYLQSIRIEKAKTLLMDSFLSIKEISFKVGFRHESTFCEEFKNVVGTSPSAYRKKIKLNESENK
jgi:AraC-like DNA-binding protein